MNGYLAPQKRLFIHVIIKSRVSNVFLFLKTLKEMGDEKVSVLLGRRIFSGRKTSNSKTKPISYGKSREEHFCALFGSVPKEEKKMYQWLNGELGKIFGFKFSKSNHKKYAVELVFFALWNTENKEHVTDHFVPRIVAY
ncbi:hypothetical protein MarSH_038 [Marseillevirus Shanghai 1]|nr:hypothetical protein MarSH_038 [Marseillevirus Shanghai 1]